MQRIQDGTYAGLDVFVVVQIGIGGGIGGGDGGGWWLIVAVGNGCDTWSGMLQSRFQLHSYSQC